MTRKLLTSAAAFLVLSGLAVPDPAMSGPAPTARIGYSDLNLATEAGRARLDSRIRNAARILCANVGDRSLLGHALARQCLEEAIASASGQIEQAVANFGAQRYAGRDRIQVMARP